MALAAQTAIIMYVMVVWSFSSLALTGEIPTITIAVFFAALSLTLFKNVIRFSMPRLVVNLFIVLVLGVIIIYCLPDPTSRLLPAVLHFFMFLEILKLFMRSPKPSDYMQIVIICFFQIVASAVSTQSWEFFFSAVGYISLTCLLLVMINAGHDVREVTRMQINITGNRKYDPKLYKITIRQVFRLVFPTFLIILISAGIFVVIPRFSANRPFMGITKHDAIQTTGFSSDVNLEELDQIYSDPTIVMRVYPDLSKFKNFQPEPIYLRGSALDFYNRHRWVRRNYITQIAAGRGRNFEFPSTFSRYTRESFPGKVSVSDTVLKYAFCVDFPQSFSFDRKLSVEMDQEAQTLMFSPSVRQPLFEYKFTSFRAMSAREIRNMQENADTERNIGGSDNQLEDMVLPFDNIVTHESVIGELPPIIRSQYLRTPLGRTQSNLSNKITNLAMGLVDRGEDDLANAINLETYLSTQYKYTLDMRSYGDADPLEAFLFEQKKGHCELFATALAHMLRSINIPSRVVTGYVTDEWNGFGRYYVVREYNAHAWVEAWIENIGWVRLDPSPSGEVLGRTSTNPTMAALTHYWDFFKIQWYKHIIDYDLNDQRTMVSRIDFGAIPSVRSLKGMSQRISNFLAALAGVESNRINSRIVILLILSGVLFTGFILLGLIQAIVRRLRRKRGQNASVRRVEIIAFYNSILKKLRKLGFERRGSQTAIEFANAVIDAHPNLVDFYIITNVYYRLRFCGNEGLTAEEDELISNFSKNLD